MTTIYDRGAVVKLCESHSVAALRKFVVETRRGQVRLLAATFDPRGKSRLVERSFSGTFAQAVVEAQRECERIRVDFDGGVRGGG